MQLKKLQYPSLYSAIRPVSHSEDLTVPVRVVLITEDLENSRIDKNNDCNDALFKGSCLPIRPKFDQLEFNNLWDLNLSKNGREFLASRLKAKDLLEKCTSTTYYRAREKEYLKFYDKKDGVVIWKKVKGLLGTYYIPSDGRLFLDASVRSLKAILIHNGNLFGSIPIAHTVVHKESYDHIKMILELIKYECHNWKICVELKMVSILLGQQDGYTK